MVELSSPEDVDTAATMWVRSAGGEEGCFPREWTFLNTTSEETEKEGEEAEGGGVVKLEIAEGEAGTLLRGDRSVLLLEI